MVEDTTGGAALDRSTSSTISSFIPDPDQVRSIEPLGDGNINATYLVSFRNRFSLVVQRLNGEVFPDPVTVVSNVAKVTDSLATRVSADSGRWGFCRFPGVVKTRFGKNWYEDRSGGIWRCLSYIDKAVCYPRVVHSNQAFEAGKMLGCFHQLLESFDGSALSDPLPGFHDLHQYKLAYLEAIGVHNRHLTSEFAYCQQMIEDRLESLSLEELGRENQIPRRVIHGDPKCDNFLFDVDSGRAISLIDLDTVSHGLLAVDLGDCLRSLCNPAGEKARSDVTFDREICSRLLQGYLKIYTPEQAERNLIYHGVRLLTYELGLRFFTDHLNGDCYFKIAREGENLLRARVQFQLLESIEQQRSSIEKAAGSI